LQVVDSADEKQAVVDFMKPYVALYMGGMGAKDQNFHKNVFERMGFGHVTDEVQRLFLAGERDKATALIPDELVDDLHIIGTAGEVRERVAQWAETGVTELVLSLRTPEDVRRVAETLA
jgi:alkanesulfonate monooxygenase SsuD/methylene tetrahydromethanopterin reductase-like flavin-dependent oxidoreductase (luciferase family)